jgi:hypothetical protein
LVILEVKDAYLVDVCYLSADQALFVLKSLLSTLGMIEKESSIGVVILEGNCFVIHLKLLFQRLSLLDINETLVVVDLNAPTATITSLDVTSLAMLQAFCLEISGTTQLLLESTSLIIQQFGSPFIAGLLLNYPVLYLAKPSVDRGYQLSSEILSFSSLRKVNMTVKCTLGKKLLFGNHVNSTDCVWSVMEFSYPSSLIVDDPIAQLRIRGVLNSWKDSMAFKIDQLNFSKQLFDRMALNFDEIVVETQTISL